MKEAREFIMKCVFILTACVSIAAVVLICIFMFANGIPAIAMEKSSDQVSIGAVILVSSGYAPVRLGSSSKNSSSQSRLKTPDR